MLSNFLSMSLTFVTVSLTVCGPDSQDNFFVVLYEIDVVT